MKFKLFSSVFVLTLLFSACSTDLLDQVNDDGDGGVFLRSASAPQTTIITKSDYDKAAGTEYKGSAKETIAEGVTFQKVNGNYDLIFGNVPNGEITLYVKNGNIFTAYTFVNWSNSKYTFSNKDVSNIKYGAFEAAPVEILVPDMFTVSFIKIGFEGSGDIVLNSYQVEDGGQILWGASWGHPVTDFDYWGLTPDKEYNGWWYQKVGEEWIKFIEFNAVAPAVTSDLILTPGWQFKESAVLDLTELENAIQAAEAFLAEYDCQYAAYDWVIKKINELYSLKRAAVELLTVTTQEDLDRFLGEINIAGNINYATNNLLVLKSEASGLDVAIATGEAFMAEDFSAYTEESVAKAKAWVNAKLYELYAIKPCGLSVEDIKNLVKQNNITANIDYARGLLEIPAVPVFARAEVKSYDKNSLEGGNNDRLTFTITVTMSDDSTYDVRHEKQQVKQSGTTILEYDDYNVSVNIKNNKVFEIYVL